MLEQLKLKNFQTHKSSTFNFSPGINVITGPNDKGKSSIIRAIYWLAFNRPSGDEFIREGSKSCSVQGVFNDVSVTRKKGKSENKYVVDGQVFNALRSDVPSEVKDIIKLSKTNIQLQHDPHFLLSYNSSEVAKALNQVVGLDQIDTSFQVPNRIIRQNNSSIDHIQKDIDYYKKALKKFRGLNKIEKLVDQYEHVLKLKKDLKSSINKLEEVTSSLRDSERIEKKHKALQSVQKKLTKMESKLEKIKEKSSTADRLGRTIKTLTETKDPSKKIRKVEKINESIQSMENILESLNNEKTHLSKISSHMSSIQSSSKELEKMNSEYKETKETFDKKQEELGMCPFCERSFD